MTRLTDVGWLNDTQREILAPHNVVTLEELASFELRDSFADVVPIPNLRGWARRARQELGGDDPMAQVGQASGHRGPVHYAGGVKFGGHDG